MSFLKDTLRVGAAIVAPELSMLYEQREQNEQREKLAERKAALENKKSTLRARRERAKLVSRARVANAQNIVQGVSGGTGGGSSQLGALSSSQSNVLSNIGLSNQLLNANRTAAAVEMRAMENINNSAQFSALANTSMNTRNQIISTFGSK